MTSTDIRNRYAENDIALDKMNESGTVVKSSPGGMDMYTLYYTTSRLNVRLHRGDANSPAEYYFQTKFRTIGKPQLYLRKGGAKKSPTVGVGKIQWTSRHMLVARGNYEQQADDMVWNELNRDRNAFVCSDYHMAVRDADATASKESTVLHWRKDMDKLMATVYDCVDEKGAVIARLRSGGGLNWKKGGELDVSSALSESLKEWALLSALSIWAWEALDYQSLRQGYDKDGAKVQ